MLSCDEQENCFLPRPLQLHVTKYYNLNVCENISQQEYSGCANKVCPSFSLGLLQFKIMFPGGIQARADQVKMPNIYINPCPAEPG